MNTPALMSNDLVVRLPQVSNKVQIWIEDVFDREFASIHAAGGVLPEVMEEARTLAPLYNAMLSSAPTRDAVMQWMAGISSAVRFAPAKEEFMHRVMAVAQVCAGDIPAAAFCRETQLEAMRTFDQWPSAKQVRDLLLAWTQKLRRTAAGLQALSEGRGSLYARPRATAPEAPKAARTEESNAYIRNLLDREFGPSESQKLSDKLKAEMDVALSDAHLRSRHPQSIWKRRRDAATTPAARAVAQARLAAMDQSDG